MINHQPASSAPAGCTTGFGPRFLLAPTVGPCPIHGSRPLDPIARRPLFVDTRRHLLPDAIASIASSPTHRRMLHFFTLHLIPIITCSIAFSPLIITRLASPSRVPMATALDPPGHIGKSGSPMDLDPASSNRSSPNASSTFLADVV